MDQRSSALLIEDDRTTRSRLRFGSLYAEFWSEFSPRLWSSRRNTMTD